MARRATKSAQILPIDLVPSGGIDLSRPPSQIDDNALHAAINFYYDPNSQGVLITRPGLVCVTATALPDPIRQLHNYVIDADSSYLIAVSGDKVKKLNAAGTGWDDIFTLPNSTVVPQFLTFNGKLLIACGDPGGIPYWDGGATGYLTGSPKASAIVEVVNRVAANAVDEPDSVYLSGPENENDWVLTSPGAAVGLRAGFGDGLNVNGFAVLYDTLVVSKTGDARKTLYAYNLSGTPDYWEENRQLLSPGNAAIGPLAIQSVGDKVYFIDRNGAKALIPPQLFGAITSDPMYGNKINRVLSRYTGDATGAQLRFVPSLASVFITIDSPTIGYRCFVYSTTTNAFTEMFFGGTAASKMLTVLDADGVVFMAGESGFLYAFGGGSRDELIPGSMSEYTGILRSKIYRGGGHGMILRQTAIDVEYISPGTIAYAVFGNDRTAIDQYPAYEAGTNVSIYDSNTPIYSASWAIGADPVTEIVDTSRVRSRKGMQFSIRTLGGARVVFNGLLAETTIVQR